MSARLRAALACAVCFVCTASRLPPAQAAPRVEDNRTRGKRLFEEGQRDYLQRNYAGALEAFDAAYQAWGEPRLLYNIAQCQRQLGREEDALKSYQTFLRLADAGDPLLPEVRRRSAELDASIGARQKAASAAEREEQARAHEEAERARAASARRDALLRAGVNDEDVDPVRAQARLRRGRALRWAGIGIGLAGIALVAGGAAPAMGASDARSSLELDAQAGRAFDAGTEDRLDRNRSVSGVLFGVGGALVLGGVAILSTGLGIEARAKRHLALGERLR